MLDARLECRSTDRHIAAAGGTEPIDRLQAEVIDRRLGRLLPRVIEEDSLSEGAALARPVECNDGDAEVGHRQQEVVELLDERIVSAGEDERAALLALCLQPEARK